MGAQRSLAAPGGSRVRENPHLGAFAAPRHAITETSAGGREASEGPTLFHFFIFFARSGGNFTIPVGERSDGKFLQAPPGAARRVYRRWALPSRRFAAGSRFIQAAARAGSPPAKQAVLTPPPLHAELASRSLNTAESPGPSSPLAR